MTGTEYDLLGRVTDQMALEYIKKHNNFFISQNFGISITRDGINLPSGKHIHSSYELLILFSQPFTTKLEKHNYIIESNRIFPFNTEQYHGPQSRLTGFQAMCITIEKDYIDDITYKVFGKENIVFQNNNYKLNNEIRILLQLYILECKNKQIGHDFILQSLSNHISVNLIRQIKNNLSNLLDNNKYSDKPCIKRVIEYFNENYNKEFSMEDISRVANYSPYHLIRVFKSETGKTPYGYLMDIKVERAKEMLRFTDKTITEICYSSGFKGIDHFNAVFKRKTGVSPSHFRKFSLFHDN